jgi:iron complex outermembrane receptor protein
MPKCAKQPLHRCKSIASLACLLLWMVCLQVNAQSASEQTYNIDLPAQSVAASLTSLSEQTDVLVLFPYDIAEPRRGHPVVGRFTLQEALDILLRGTGLSPSVSEKGVLTVALENTEELAEPAAASNVVITGAFNRWFGRGSTDQVQASAASSEPLLEEVIVTSQKHSQSVNDVGMTITVMSGGHLRDLRVDSAVDLALITPGLQVNESAPTGVPLYSIRGVGFQDFTTAASSTVGLYFDGVNIPYSVMTRGALFDMERVEVLRGPQGDLYGRNTTAGQINFISKNTTPEFDAGISASYSSYETMDLEGYVSGPLSDVSRGRLAFKTTQSREGWQKSLTRDDELGEKDIYALRGIVDIELGESAFLKLIAHHVRDESENQAPAAYNGQDRGGDTIAFDVHTPLEQYTDNLTSLDSSPPWFAREEARDADWSGDYRNPISGANFDLRPKRDNKLQGLSAKLQWDLLGVSLTSLTAYGAFEREEVNEGDGGDFIDVANINTTDINVFSQELTLSATRNEFLWIMGLYYSRDEVDESYHFLLPDSAFGNGAVAWNREPFNQSPILELETLYEQKTESRAVFGHVEWSLRENWRLTLGARYTDEKRDWSGCTYSAADNSLGALLNTQFNANLKAGDCATLDDDPSSPYYFEPLLNTPQIDNAFHAFSDSIRSKRWMGKVGLDYKLYDDTLLFVTWSRGFKSGGFNGASSSTTLQLQPYGEEQLTAIELGSKSTLLDGSLQLNATVFYYDYKDKQETDTAVTFVGNIAGLTNIPKSRIQGGEIELQWVPLSGLNLHFSAAYLDSEIKQWNAVDTESSVWPDVVTFDASGLELPQAPKWSWASFINYRKPIGGGLYVEIGADVSYTDETAGGFQNPIASATDEYTLYGARLALGPSDERWRAQLWARNLTDEFYFPSAFTGNGPYVRMVGMPRTVGLTLDYQL